MPEEELDPAVTIRAEIEAFGRATRIYPDRKKQYAVIDVDDKYSPRLTLYSLSTGKTGEMKVKKPYYTKNKVNTGDIITVTEWIKKPARTFQDGQMIPVKGKFELWIDSYSPVT